MATRFWILEGRPLLRFEKPKNCFRPQTLSHEAWNIAPKARGLRHVVAMRDCRRNRRECLSDELRGEETYLSESGSHGDVGETKTDATEDSQWSETTGVGSESSLFPLPFAGPGPSTCIDISQGAPSHVTPQICASPYPHITNPDTSSQ